MHRIAKILTITAIGSSIYYITHTSQTWALWIAIIVQLIGIGLYEIGNHRKYYRSKPMHKSSFTLLEILIVVTIIFVLAGMVLAVMGPVKRHIRDTKTKAQVKQFELMFESYYQDWGYYPQQSTADIIDAHFFASLTTADQGTPLFREEDFDFDTSDDTTTPEGLTYYRPVNGHSQPFYYQAPGTVHPESFDIWCAGYDGLFGGNATDPATANPVDSQNISVRPEDSNDDIANWKRLH